MFSIIQAAGWPIWPLIACSVIALAIVLERFAMLRTAKVAPANLVSEVLSVTAQTLPAPSVIAQLGSSSPLGSVMASGLATLQQHPHSTEDDLRAALESSGRRAIHALDKHLPTLATIASIAPLLGLLGTVIGMIEIFGAQPTGGAGSNPAQLAHGISVALYNTAFGLIVAIPCLVFWRYFRQRVETLQLVLESGADRLLRHLSTLRAP
ncbi:MAG: MotA/TolQ/ExbB proton channel family protein [Xylophilus ampelinus]